MKKLVLVDDTEYSVLDDSGVGNIRIPVENFAEADDIAVKMVKANMTTIELGLEEFHEVNPIDIRVAKEDGQLICSVYCQESLQDYIQNQLDNYTEKLIEEGVI